MLHLLGVAGLSNGVGAALISEAIGDPERLPSAEAAQLNPHPTYPSNVPDPEGSSTSHGVQGIEFFFFKLLMRSFSGCPSGVSRDTSLITEVICSANQLPESNKGIKMYFFLALLYYFNFTLDLYVFLLNGKPLLSAYFFLYQEFTLKLQRKIVYIPGKCFMRKKSVKSW